MIRTVARLGVIGAVRLAVGRATLADLWDRLAEAYGRRTVLTLAEPLALKILTASELTHEDLLDVIARTAGGLQELGVRRGERVAICTANRVDYAISIFAAIRAGAIAVPLHHGLKPGEIATLARQAKARLAIVERATGRLKGTRTVFAGRGGEVDEATAASPRIPPETIDPEAPAAILFTSGTTGVPKGATLTSRSLLAVARLAALVPDAGDERGVCGLPLAHVMGLSTFLFNALAGSRMHWLTKFDAGAAMDAIAAQRSTFFIGVPAMYAMLAEEGAESRDLSTIKLWASGADAMPPALAAKFQTWGCALRSPLGQRLLTAAFAEVYGMVELSGPAILKLHPPVPASERVMKRFTGANAYGIPIPPYRAKIVDDAGKPSKAGTVGELLIKGPGVTKGYDRDPKATGKATDGGWLKTGDFAKRNRLGLISFVSRKKDVIKHGGFSVFPAEVEAQLMTHGEIAEAVVIGAPHPTKGAVPVAVVVKSKGSSLTEMALLDWCKAEIAGYKSPRAVLFVKSAEIPRNANKKVLKDALKEAMLPRLAKLR
jgi:long-chain acyl-CoA synthetase